MRTRNLLSRIAFSAIVAGSITLAGQIQAANDFDALLAEVDFGAAAAEIEEAVSPSASDIVDLPTEPVGLANQASELTSTPAAGAMALPQEPTQPLPAPPAPPAAPPLTDPAPEAMPAAPAMASPAMTAPAATMASPATGAASCGQCASSCGSCRKGCGLHGHDPLIKECQCMPYTPPRLPTSTFYQYWRSNACYTNVWDDYRNRCCKYIDPSIHPKSKSCGCRNGCCNVHPASAADCGPVPAEWCDKGQCDSAGCDGK